MHHLEDELLRYALHVINHPASSITHFNHQKLKRSGWCKGFMSVTYPFCSYRCGVEDGPEKEDGETDGKTGPKQRQQQEREERQRREVLEAVLAVGPPVRSRPSERGQNDGASKVREDGGAGVKREGFCGPIRSKDLSFSHTHHPPNRPQFSAACLAEAAAASQRPLRPLLLHPPLQACHGR